MSKSRGRVAVLGAGVIGASWAARIAHAGYDVALYDPVAASRTRAFEVIERGSEALQSLSPSQSEGRGRGKIDFSTDLDATLKSVTFVQECAPEREDLKQQLLRKVCEATGPEVIVASSSSALLPSRLQDGCRNPDRVLVGHPFNPVYLIPLCEIVPGPKTAERTIGASKAFYDTLGMHSLIIRKEISGYVANRLQEALWTEALHLIDQGIVNAEEIDASVIYGPGLRWAFMGAFLTFHLGGGAGGMRHFIDHFGDSLESPNCYGTPPKATEALKAKIIDQTEAATHGKSVAELERIRDRCLVAVLKALKEEGYAAGLTVKG